MINTGHWLGAHGERFSEWLGRSELTKDDAVAVFVNVNQGGLFYMDMLSQLEADAIELGPRAAWCLQEESIFGWEYK